MSDATVDRKIQNEPNMILARCLFRAAGNVPRVQQFQCRQG